MIPLKIKCPCCTRAIAPPTGFRHATEVLRRKCRGCGRSWLLKVRPMGPLAKGAAFAHELAWMIQPGTTP